MARSLHDLITRKVVRDKNGLEVSSPRGLEGSRILVVQPDGEVLVLRATEVSVEFHSHGFPTMSISGLIEEVTSVDGVLLESTELNPSPLPDSKTKRRIEEA